MNLFILTSDTANNNVVQVVLKKDLDTFESVPSVKVLTNEDEGKQEDGQKA